MHVEDPHSTALGLILLSFRPRSNFTHTIAAKVCATERIYCFQPLPEKHAPTYLKDVQPQYRLPIYFCLVVFFVSLSRPYSVEIRSLWLILFHPLPQVPSVNRRILLVISPILSILYDALVV